MAASSNDAKRASISSHESVWSITAESTGVAGVEPHAGVSMANHGPPRIAMIGDIMAGTDLGGQGGECCERTQGATVLAALRAVRASQLRAAVRARRWGDLQYGVRAHRVRPYRRIAKPATFQSARNVKPTTTVRSVLTTQPRP